MLPTLVCVLLSFVKTIQEEGRSLKSHLSIFTPKIRLSGLKREVSLKTEADGRMFPESNDSQTIVECLVRALKKVGAKLATQSFVTVSNYPFEKGFKLSINNEELYFDKLIVATGGSPKLSGMQWLSDLGYSIEKPVPSLFTFNMPSESIRELMGVVAPNANVKIQGTKQKQSGPALITHWGMSGPAIRRHQHLKQEHFNQNYQFKTQINWTDTSEQEYLEIIEVQKNKKMTKNPFNLPNRLWLFLLDRIDINPENTWNQLGKKNKNRLLNVLMNDVYG